MSFILYEGWTFSAIIKFSIKKNTRMYDVRCPSWYISTQANVMTNSPIDTEHWGERSSTVNVSGWSEMSARGLLFSEIAL